MKRTAKKYKSDLKPFMISLRPEQIEQLKELGRKQERPATFLIRAAVDLYLKEQQGTAA